MKLSRLTTAERLFNAAAIISLVASILMWAFGYQLEAVFVGLWVPSILAWMNFFTLKEEILANQRKLLSQDAADGGPSEPGA